MPLRRFALLAGAFYMIALGHTDRAVSHERPLYRIVKAIPLGAPDRWDLLTFDSTTQAVFVSHGDRVSAIDGRTGAKLADIPGIAGTSHGVALVPEMGHGYSDDGVAGTVIPFDLKTWRLGTSIKAQADADAIVFDPATAHLFVIDGDSGKVTVLDPLTDAVVATIDVGGKLEIGVADGLGALFVNGESERELVRIDTRMNQVAARWSIEQCTSPHGIAIDTHARRVFTSCENNILLAIDADTGKIIASLPIGSHTDGAAFDPLRRRVFSSNGDGTLTVIAEKSPNSFVILGNVQTMLGARTMTLDPHTGRLYLVAADMKLNESAAPSDVKHRFSITPGSVKLLFLDPVR